VPIPKHLRPLYKTPAYLAARAATLARAQWKCEHCDRPAGALAWVYRRRRRPGTPAGALTFSRIQLGVAHLDHTPGHDELDNLAALCRACHLRHDRGQHRDTRATHKDERRPLLAAIA
jgi:5-methylcytosine-specific restriction endonuclease McrA